MSSNPENPKPPALGEGDLFLFVRINTKSNEFQVLYTDIVSALALQSLAETHLEMLKRKIMAPVTAVQVPNIGLPSFDELRRRGA